ncbi:MAG: hypothetical protein PHS49_06540 [Candidatus Gracilibacteria bacterium]|nr:hypothetical protein [Candidatus Gracilibacteria bacterium]
MSTITTTFEIGGKSKISSLISGRRFKNDRELLETIEDFLFGKMMEESDVGDYVSEDEVFKILNKNVG